MQEWLLPALITAITGIGVATFLRFMPKQKLLAIVQPKARFAGKMLNRFLFLRLGKKAAQNLEENIIATLAAVLYAAIDSFMKGLLEDN